MSPSQSLYNISWEMRGTREEERDGPKEEDRVSAVHCKRVGYARQRE